MHLKNQILGNLIFNGKKNFGENILLKVVKRLYQITNKSIKKVFNIRFIDLFPIFKISKIVNQKTKWIQKSFIIIWKQKARLSLSIKFFLTSIKKRKSNYLYIKIVNTLFNINEKDLAFKLKNIYQKQALLKKHLFYYYKWK